MNIPAELQSIPSISQLADQADVIDIKTIEGDVSMAQFIAGTMNYYPAWVKALYGVRWVFVRFLGMKQNGLPRQQRMQPEDVPMQRGKYASFFKVEAAEPERYWLVSAKESHLAAYLGIVAQTLSGSHKRFYLVTIVHYRKWTGRFYFGVIRPFHHLVVKGMARAGLRH